MRPSKRLDGCGYKTGLEADLPAGEEVAPGGFVVSNSMYTDYADEYEAAIQENIFNGKFERPSLLGLLPALNGKQVLDLGCGPGVYAAELVARGAIVTGIDVSEKMIEITRSKMGDACRCYVQDISIGLPDEPSEQFDIVICPLVIHYLADLNRLFSDVHRVLKAGGLFVFSTHHPYPDFERSPSANYFATEAVVEEWDTLGRPVPVTFYRRPISAIANAIAEAQMFIANISEGKVSKALKQASPELYSRLSTSPHFMFYQCKPLRGLPESPVGQS
ncbi:class I SAM-dependent methyltransferase [Aestuariirhabdus sp. Z084]|uniref:class I SAM-dependent DNA methyltransferase n=1 Tax=Aestuariirhabdus haliotis TaxID=2918751 RepID=UPI00201B42C6|nr:class I SAM-dependent methyltransferase [Aestuariirhabdus haliotis]MCL6416416.1 class I SAM-dependent methyltransferase [Aestuariirhabdus haliotis]MCL6420418.1 class I SAM-dependent methyltransferase [Aestuariirhabdus haliotis]